MRKLHYIAIILLLAAIVVPALMSISKSAGTISTSSLNSGLVGHWPLDSASNRSTTVTADKTPNSMHGTASSLGNPTLGGATDMHGQASRATEFDGGDDNINLGDLTYLNSVSKFSMSFWMNQDILDQTDWIFYKRLDSNSRLWLWIDGVDGNMKFYMSKTTDIYGKFDYSNVYSAGTWAHVAVVYDGTQSTNATKLKIFINGSQQTLSFTGTIPTSTPDLAGYNAYLGAVPGYGSYAFDGKLADFRIYNRDLSTTEVTSLYNAYRPKIAVSSLSSGLVGHWDLSQTSLKSSTTIADLTPNGNTGTAGGGVTLGGAADMHGQANRATEFDGNNDNINLGDLTYLNSVSKFSMSFWMNQDVLDVTDDIFLKYTDSSNATYIQIINDGTMRFYIVNGSNSYGYFDYSTAISANNWYHCVVIYDGTQSTNATKLKVYLNNSPITLSFNLTIPVATSNTTGTNAYLGYTSSAFDGKLADFRIYNRAISTTEITSLYDSYRPKISTGNINKGLVGEWKLRQADAKSSTITDDYTPNSNDGTLVGSPTFTTDQHGQANRAMSFNGSSQYVNVGNSSVLNPTVAITLSAWIKPNPTGVGVEYYVIGRDNCVDLRAYAFGIVYVETNISYLRFQINGGNKIGLGTIPMTNGIWYHIAVSGNSSQGYIGYVNGVVDSSPSWTAPNSVSSNTTIGSRSGTYPNYFPGSMADMRIYNRALSATEVTALYNAY